MRLEMNRETYTMLVEELTDLRHSTFGEKTDKEYSEMIEDILEGHWILPENDTGDYVTTKYDN